MSTFHLFAFGIPAVGILLAIAASRLLVRRHSVKIRHHSGKTVVVTRTKEGEIDGTVTNEEASDPKERTDQHPEDEAEARRGEELESAPRQEEDRRQYEDRLRREEGRRRDDDERLRRLERIRRTPDESRSHPDDEAEERWESRNQQEVDRRGFDESDRLWREERLREEDDRQRREDEAAQHEPKRSDAVQPQSKEAREEPKLNQLPLDIDRQIRELQEKLDRFSRDREAELRPELSTDASRRSRSEKPIGVKAIQEVLFATNRLVHDDRVFNLNSVTHLWTSFYTYGRAWVSIPGRHRIAVVERPKFNWLQMRMEKESPDKHFMIGELNKLTDEAFFAAARSQENSALVFVHGYNVSFADAIFKTAQIVFDANFPGKAVAFSWPSSASIEDYDYDREGALASPGALLSLLSRIKADAKIENLFVVAHSLGSQVVIDALQMASLSGIDLNLREVIFAAPDVDRNVFISRAELVKQVAGGVTLYASSADKALIASKIKARGIPRAGDIPVDGPLHLEWISSTSPHLEKTCWPSTTAFSQATDLFSMILAGSSRPGRDLLTSGPRPCDRCPIERHPNIGCILDRRDGMRRLDARAVG
jgi:esterase/lipase superfamily enzyme